MPATFTSRLGLRKPDGTAPDSDNVNVVTDLNDNYDKIDTHLGFYVCTSSTRPTGSDRFTGRQIFETDTKARYIWTGTEWYLLSELYFTKSVDEAVSSTTIQPDNHIQIPLTPGTWIVDTWIFATGHDQNDVDVNWDFSGTATGTPTRGFIGPAGSSGDTFNTIVAIGKNFFATERGYALDTNFTIMIWEHIRIVVSASGTLTLQWARNTNTQAGTPTTFTTDTHALAKRVA